MHRSAVKLPGAFFSDYWTQLLFQAVATEPSIRHAVLAVGSAHREEVEGAGALVGGSNDEHTLFTVRQYSKAINYLHTCLRDGGRTSVRITLITCALFIYLEFLRGHYTQGLVHLEHGLGLLHRTEAAVESKGHSSVNIDDWLATFFLRPLIQAKLLGQVLRVPRHSFLDRSSQPERDTFRSIHHARGCLEQIMLRTFDLQDRAQQSTRPVVAKIGPNLLGDRDIIQAELQIWIETYEVTMRDLPPTHSASEVFGYRLLRIYCHVAVISAGTCLETSSQLVCDQYDSDFTAIISQSIDIYDIRRVVEKRNATSHLDPESSSPNSVSDIGWITPLYFTATKCRNHRLRHQAVQLLQKKPHKEGIWSSTLAVIISRKVIDLEEGSFYHHLGQDIFDEFAAPTAEDLAIPALPEERRLSRINIVLPHDRAGKLLLHCCRYERSGLIEWISKEYDLPSQRWNDIPWSALTNRSLPSPP